MEEAANAALKKLDGRYVSPTTLKGMISEAHPTPPMEVVAHHLQQVSTQPPLNEICMLDDFAIEDWPSFRNDKIQWFASLQDAPFPPKVRSPLYIKFRPYLFHATKRIYESKVWRQQQQRDPLELNFHYGSGEGSCVGSPDMVITDSSNDETLVVGVMAMDPTGRPALARLYSYLLLTDCSFGVVSSYMRTACCKRVGSRLLVSQGVSHVESPMMGIGFMLAEALQNKKHKPALPLRSLHLSYARGVFEECCRAQQVRSVGQMVSGLGALDIGDVRELRFACSGFEGLTIVVRGLYKGRTIVVKAKDLSGFSNIKSNSDTSSFAGFLRILSRPSNWYFQNNNVGKRPKFGQCQLLCETVLAMHVNALPAVLLTISVTFGTSSWTSSCVVATESKPKTGLNQLEVVV
ncbi:hypothetical protein SELMODRAFT_419266 [Selaginella moellendorffii]|uniref:Uncharacterized protein n=1 Tax=Selaginella moellendorffii TaxID=88036 RepID=D8S8D4_SELML|nr:hypothetical protein SELMODRAFT_419266 [Selaginella moellendorffii]